MECQLNYKFLRENRADALVDYFQRLLQHYENRTITEQLLKGLSNDSVPLGVLSIWISGLADSKSLPVLLCYKDSISVRRIAIRRLGESLRKKTFLETWHGLGGTEGILQILTESSVNDVADFCRAVGRSGTSTKLRQERQKRTTELLKALASDYFPSSNFKNLETRPLLGYYSVILPACTTEFIDQWDNHANLPGTCPLLESRTAEYQQMYIQSMERDGSDNKMRELSSLVSYFPCRPASKILSESMRFALQVLQVLDSGIGPGIRANYILHDLAYPLLRRLERRKLSTSQLRCEVIQTVLRCLKARRDGCQMLDLATTGLLGFAVRLWYRHPQRYESLLISVIQATSGRRSSLLSSVKSVLDLVRCDCRYKLLRLILLYLNDLRKEIENDRDLQSLDELWPVELFFTLPTEQSRAILDRLMRLRPSEEFINWAARSRYSLDIFSIMHPQRTLLLHVYLSRNVPGALEETWEIIKEYKKGTVSCRDQAERVNQAKPAILFAIASGSLDCYEEVFHWARRFDKDALTVKQLYARDAIHTNESVELLCGISARSAGITPRIEQVHMNVEQGNRIMLKLLETACMAVREPSFAAYDWKAVLDIFSVVIRLRVKRSIELQNDLSLSDEQLYEIVFIGTIKTLLAAEEVGLSEANEKLGFNQINGPLPSLDASKELMSRKAICQFVDNLARQRHELWQKYRRSKHPAVVTLIEPWTMGLPLQCLAPYDGSVSGAGQNMPFLFRRAESIVFIEPQLALAEEPQDLETQQAIGPFVDSYFSALYFYVRASENGEQAAAAKHAWDYAWNYLTPSELDRTAAFYFWKDKFSAAKIEVPQPDWKPLERPVLVLPAVENASDPTEWDPDPEPQMWMRKYVQRSATCLDCLFCRPFQPSQDIDSPLIPEGRITIPIPPQDPVWVARWKVLGRSLSGGAESSISPRSREALLAMAALHISTMKNAGPRILTVPFPSKQEPRFPSLFLAEEFIDRKDLNRDLGEKLLEVLGAEVPPSLLLTLCQAMIKTIDMRASEAHKEYDTIRMIKILVGCDRPQIAFDLMRHILIERPGNSTWHRHLLNVGLLQKIPASEIQEFFRTLVNEIRVKLHESAKEIKPSREGAPEKTSPVVKVTTVKMIAQLLSGASFIPQSVTVDILTGLFAQSRHLDILVAIIEALMLTLTNTRDDKLKARILDILEEHAVPVAASVNEQQPLTEEEWQAAELTGNLPDLYPPSLHSLSPVFSTLVNASTTISSPFKEEFVDRILLPVLDMSIANCQRWIRLFSKTIPDFPLSIDELPAVPINPMMIPALINAHLSLVPRAVLDIWAEASMTNLEPSPTLRQVNDTLRLSPRPSNAEVLWLQLWGQQDSALSWGDDFLTISLQNELIPKRIDGITNEMFKEIAIRQVESLIMNADETLSEVEWFLQFFQLPTWTNENLWDLWQQNVRPLIDWIIKRIDGLRTPRWQQDPMRRPMALKDTFGMKLWLLSYPVHDRCNPQGLDIFVEELLDGIASVATDRRPYYERFALLKQAAIKCPPVEFCYLACKFGSLEQINIQNPTLTDFLRIEIAEQYLRRAHTPHIASFAEEARALLDRWIGCECEEIRMKGLLITKELRKPKSGHWLEHL